MTIDNLPALRACRPAWNKGRIVGQKRPLLPKHVWAIRVRLEIATNVRDLALFNLAIDSKLRGCDLVRLKVADVYAAGQVKERASIIQSKTRKPVRFEITEGTRKSIAAWLDNPLMIGSEHLWPGRFHERLWHPYDAPDQGRADLPQDRQSPRRAIVARSHQDGQHGAISRRRTGRRARNR